jgi:hypothetical protein
MGLVFALWTLICLWLGQIPSRGRSVARSSESFQFHAWIFCYSLLATLFIGAGIMFFLHPQFGLVPVAQVSDD